MLSFLRIQESPIHAECEIPEFAGIIGYRTTIKFYIKNIIILIIIFLINTTFNYAAANDTLTKKVTTLVENTDADVSIPIEKFRYAGDQRFTIDGSLPLKESKIKPLNTIILGTIVTGGLVGLHIMMQNAWWKNSRGGFHFEEDFVSALQVDKAGHSYVAYLSSYAANEALLTSGFSYDASAIIGSAMGLGFETMIEIEDGFSKDWGFSPSDFYFDLAGATFFLAQHYVPALQNITPKWTYFPTEWTGQPVLNRPRNIGDDYNSSAFWWSINVHNILPDNFKNFWPKWLNIALGYGGNAIDANPDPNGPPDQLSVRRYMIALDYNMVQLLPDGCPFWNWCKQTMNIFKFPAPTIEFSKTGTRFYLMYPFRFKLGGIKF